MITEGTDEGVKDGIKVGVIVGDNVGVPVGLRVGYNVGVNVREVGDMVGADEGVMVVDIVGVERTTMHQVHPKVIKVLSHCRMP